MQHEFWKVQWFGIYSILKSQMLKSWLFVCGVVIKWWNLSEAGSSGRKMDYSQIRLERDIGTITHCSPYPGHQVLWENALIHRKNLSFVLI